MLVVNDGSGRLTPEDADPLEVTAGDSWLIPHAAGEIEVAGQLSAIRCFASVPD